MCGINGIYSTSVKDRNQIVGKMNEELDHRGPDAQDVFESEELTLGHTRLKIIDLSDSANQPMTCAFDRFVLVFNGEIYNIKS